jgi:hypothetical protein
MDEISSKVSDSFTPQSLSNLDKDRFAGYKRSLDFYDGNQWTERSRNRQLVFNYTRIAIDKITSYLMQGLNFACDAREPESDGATQFAEKAEQLIYHVYQDNALEQLDYETETDAAILGDGCYKVTWDAEEKRIRVTSPDVNGLYAWWKADDPSRVWRVASRYQLAKDEIARLYNRTINKKNAYLTELWTAQQFTLYLDNEVIDNKPNPYGFIPFIIFPNLRKPKQFWGISDIPALQEAQRELNRALTQLSRILEVSGNPIAVLEGVESSEDIRVQPGAVWTLPEESKAYLLDLLEGGGIRLHIDYIEMLYRCLHDISEAPRASYGGIDKELSGVALEVELQSLLQKVQRKRTIRTSVYTRRNKMILELHRLFNREDLTNVLHRIIWGQVLPQDREREAQNEQLLVQSGVHSRRTAMDEMGVRDPEKEFERWMDERRQILEMNERFKAKSTRGGERARNYSGEMEPLSD